MRPLATIHSPPELLDFILVGTAPQPKRRENKNTTIQGPTNPMRVASVSGGGTTIFLQDTDSDGTGSLAFDVLELLVAMLCLASGGFQCGGGGVWGVGEGGWRGVGRGVAGGGGGVVVGALALGIQQVRTRMRGVIRISHSQEMSKNGD